ncbi:PREDICTED: ladinin-1 isoform X2 [Pseudopodoces humilis]|uniref:ladinin-1 isoform X2 n=1 Tax=Pseudopodoces humilis TaxID=181119 RepID=UPI0006B874CF|nr:PREDICTED: ladinin-1 isoform X2 [Pseudopodoces humilis]
MSLSRRNWSDLSSLARQRTLEDEEEQQRERRRRHRNLLSSTSMDEEPASPVKDTSPASSRPPSLVKLQSLEDGEEQKTQEGRRTRWLPAACEKPRQEPEQKEPGVGGSCPEPGAQPRRRQESGRAAEQGQEPAKGRGDPAGDKNLEPASERKGMVRARLQDKEQGAWTPRGEQRKEPPEVGSCRLREVKILTRVGNRSTEEKTSAGTSSPEQQQPPRNPSKQVIQEFPPRDEPAEKPDPSPTHITFSSSIRRASPRTVSFRIISRKQKEESPSPLTRSASLRIPGSNSTIGEKLEKYNSAVQDSLRIPGSVTSRINLWISRAQEPAKEENTKEIRRINSLPKRDVWIKQPGDTSGDTKLQ